MRVAVIREEGSNGDREMAAAVWSGGMEPWDLTMSDLLNGRASLDSFQGQNETQNIQNQERLGLKTSMPWDVVKEMFTGDLSFSLTCPFWRGGVGRGEGISLVLSTAAVSSVYSKSSVMTPCSLEVAVLHRQGMQHGDISLVGCPQYALPAGFGQHVPMARYTLLFFPFFLLILHLTCVPCISDGDSQCSSHCHFFLELVWQVTVIGNLVSPVIHFTTP